MYEAYWQLTTKPFENSADPRLNYPSQAQQGALLKLRYTLENHRSASLLAGAAGLGKTWLVQNLLRSLPERFAPKVHLVFPQMPPEQLLCHLADKLTGTPTAGSTIEQSLRRLEAYLVANCQAGKQAVVVIDEAHLLQATGALETIRLLLNMEFNHQPLASFVLAGQTALAVSVERLPELDERMAVKCLLKRFSPIETMGYIQHRLSAAGAVKTIFTDKALEAIHEQTLGVPRRINRLCDLALLVGFAEERTTLATEQIEAISDELVSVTSD